MSLSDEQSKYLGIYLEDHVAGATAGSQRAARLARAESATPEGAMLAQFAEDVATDFDALLTIMETLELEPSRLKSSVASVGEKLGALKPNGHLADRSPLTTIVELEALQMAVRGKRSMWETLHAVVPLTTSIDIAALIARADEQLTVLGGLHARRVATTLAVSSVPGPN